MFEKLQVPFTILALFLSFQLISSKWQTHSSSGYNLFFNVKRLKEISDKSFSACLTTNIAGTDDKHRLSCKYNLT